MHSLITVQARSLKSVSLGQNEGVDRAVLPLEALGKNPFLASSTFWWLLAVLSLWPHHSHLQCHHLQM